MGFRPRSVRLGCQMEYCGESTTDVSCSRPRWSPGVDLPSRYVSHCQRSNVYASLDIWNRNVRPPLAEYHDCQGCSSRFETLLSAIVRYPSMGQIARNASCISPPHPASQNFWNPFTALPVLGSTRRTLNRTYKIIVSTIIDVPRHSNPVIRTVLLKGLHCPTVT